MSVLNIGALGKTTPGAHVYLKPNKINYYTKRVGNSDIITPAPKHRPVTQFARSQTAKQIMPQSNISDFNKFARQSNSKYTFPKLKKSKSIKSIETAAEVEPDEKLRKEQYQV